MTGRAVVLGMHRSGVEQAAQALGAAGDEQVRLQQVLDTSLTELGGDWLSPPVHRLDRRSLEPHRDRLLELVEGDATVVADPRLTLFAAELPTLLGSTDGVVLCVRHPMAVARSLRRSEGVPLTTGLALWELYNVTVLTGLAGHHVQVSRGEPTEPADELDALDGHEWLTIAQDQLWQWLKAAADQPQPVLLEARALSAFATQELARADEERARDRDADEARQAAKDSAQQAGEAIGLLSTAYTRSTGSAEEPTVEELISWADGMATHESPGERIALLQDTLHQALVAVDSLRGLSEELQELWLSEEAGRSPLSHDELASWVARLRSGQREITVPVVADRDQLTRLRHLEQELLVLRQHRDAVVEQHLAVMSSQSWRVGHALTWPVRALRRSGEAPAPPA